ncbi:hypothetical protein XHV734_2961 [Xanthomonas hortorum pv. vitians]|nr:hypothetical protein XHV734_2961 [Xanthomonas hortorum pv. vitians]
MRDTPQVRPCRLGGGIHAATRSRNRRGHRTRMLVGRRVKAERLAGCVGLQVRVAEHDSSLGPVNTNGPSD